MRYKTIELKKCKRLQSNSRASHVERLFITTDSAVQIILGTNGSGKSSILSETTPLPSSKDDYFPGGGKRITADHNNSEYVFESTFDGKTIHSFIKNGVELNPGGTASVQKQLAKQEFNITPEIHQLMLGKKRFTNMDSSERRSWFTQLADTNYDFALKLFNQLKTRARDVTGALKRNKSRLVEEASKQISSEEQTRIKKEVHELHDALTLLLDNRSPITKPIVDCERDLKKGVDELNELSRRLFILKFESPYVTNDFISPERDDWGVLKPVHYNSVAEVEEAIQKWQQALAVTESFQNEAFLQYSKLKESKDILEKTGTEGVESLKTRLLALREAREELRNSRLKLVFSDPYAARSSYTAIVDTLRSVFEHIAVNDDRQFTGAGRQEMDNSIATLKEGIRTKQIQGTRYLSQREHMESHKKNSHLVCPKCHHQWSDGYDEVKYQQLLKLSEELVQSLAEDEMKLKEIEKLREDFAEYSNYYRQYTQCVNANPVLRPFWDYLTDKKTITHFPRTGINELIFLDQTIDSEIEAAKVDKTIDEVVQLINAALEVGDQNLNEVMQKMTELQIKSDTYTNDIANLNSAILKHQQYRRQLIQSAEISARIETQLNHVESMRTETVEMIRRDTLNHCIRQLQSNLSSKEETLKTLEMQANLIVDLERNVNSLIIEDEAVKILVKELSPTDGLIAEGLLSFIAEFTRKMNSLIKEVWTYPLVIHTCQPNDQGEAELDFEFPMSVRRKDNVVPDVSKGSSGIKEVVDLAFKITAMQYLHLENAPLVLDEFGITFDEVHQVQAANTVKRLIEHFSFSQLFMVSHYSSSYGNMLHAQICVLCSENITVPESMKHNQHVIIE